MTLESDHRFHTKPCGKLASTVSAGVVNYDHVDRRNARHRARDGLDYRTKRLNLIEARYLNHELHRSDSLVFTARTTIHGNAIRLATRVN